MEKMYESAFVQKAAGMKKKVAILASVSLASLFVFAAPASAADNDHMLLGNPSGATTLARIPLSASSCARPAVKFWIAPLVVA